jgi:hypothetical protein
LSSGGIERKLMLTPISTTKMVDLSVHKFHLLRGVLLVSL